VPVFRCYDPRGSNNRMSTLSLDCEGGSFWRREGVIGFAYAGQGSTPVDRIALRRFYNAKIGDHFLATDERGEIALQHGYISQGIMGYLPLDASATLPLYRFWSGSLQDHFYTTKPNEDPVLGP
ncbi:MAG TPA: hypothetical protein VFH51_12490, partial [Myxococcota bacterium]|nr:hypothetical protein [Myxococcota bacterium]